MKSKILLMAALAGTVMLGGCSDDEMGPGNPQMEIVTVEADAFFGDSLPFTINAKDIDVPLSTLKAQLYYGEEMVSEKVIRTKESGQDYSGRIYVPFLKNVHNGKATLKYVLQNINMTVSEMSQELVVARPEWSAINLVAEDGTVYPMNRVPGTYDYVVSSNFGGRVNAKIVFPAYGEYGNELTFGWNSSAIELGASMYIPFSDKTSAFEVKFNSLTYEASPFVSVLFGGRAMTPTATSGEYVLDATFTQGEIITVENLDITDWYIDPDYLQNNGDGTFTWVPITGSYRVTAISSKQYFSFAVLNEKGNPANLQDDGTGALWVIGAGVGKPSVGANEVGWVTEKALCMAPISEGVYTLTVTAGKQVSADAINFKFFGDAYSWGNELKGTDNITSSSDIVLIGGGIGGHDNGNLYLAEGKTLEVGHIYRFTVDTKGSRTSCVLSVEDIGTEDMGSVAISINGTELQQLDSDNYQAIITLTQGSTISATGLDASYWVDPDYIGSDFKFLAVDGDYRIKVNTAAKTVSAVRIIDGSEATLDADGHGAIWILGWGIGHTSNDNQPGWDPGKGYAMAEVAPKVYQYTAITAPEVGSANGQRMRYDYIDIKFFHQNGWGGEFNGNLSLVNGADFVTQTSGGNFNFVAPPIELGATVVITIDLTAGNDAGTISFVKK